MANFIDEIKDNKLLLYSFIIIIVIVLVIEGFTIYYFSLKINNSSNTSSLKEEKPTDKKEINKVVIDIKGAVNSPGTYELTDEKRVSDAIEIADGLLDNAYTKNINLSKKLTDEMVIVINTIDEINNLLKEKEEERIAADICLKESSEYNCCIEKEQSITSKISINNSSIEELMTLPGIGKMKAENIINYRTSNGPFKSVDEITKVEGIGESLYAQIKDLIIT